MDYLIIYLFLSAFFFAGFFNCWCDYINSIPERYAKTWFATFSNQNWWDFSKSGGNKWAGGLKANGEAFFGSSTFLVFVTDAWHCFKGFWLVLFAVGAAIGIVYNQAFPDVLESINIATDNWIIFLLSAWAAIGCFGLGWQISEKLIVIK